MKIHGFQKLTLLDYPNKTACTIFTPGCNYRCPFCHNSPLVTKIDKNDEYDINYVISYLKKRVGLLDGVAITGGEPLLQDDIRSFISEIKQLGYLVKLDTNGSFPEKLKNLTEDGLVDYVAMDIKNSRSDYARTVAVNSFDISKIEESIDILSNGKTDYEFRTTVVAEFHTIDNIAEIAKWIPKDAKYYLQNFVDSGNLIENGLNAVSHETLRNMREVALKYRNFCEIRGI